MFDRRLDALRATGVGRSYEPRLQWHRAELVEITARSGDATRPLVERLTLASSAHNALGAAIFHLMEAYLRVPGRSEEEKRTILRLRRLFMPRLAELRDGYATQAARATVRRQQLKAHLAELSVIPVLGEQTLAHWVGAYIEAGRKLGRLLALRADVTAQAAVSSSERADAGPLRSALIGLLGRLRAAMADELADRPERRRQLDAELFAYLDQIAEARDASHRARASQVVERDRTREAEAEDAAPSGAAA